MAHLNWKVPTLGGMQFWTDFRNVAGYRLQQNAFTGRWRVLDPQHFRLAWGTRAECESEFEQVVAAELSEFHYDRVVILLHGLMRTPRSMHAMANFLETEGKLATLRPGYASTRAGIAGHAKAFRSVVESLPGKPKIDLVAHSMGNIVIRHALADWQQAGDPAGVLPQFHRMVMLGPPNQGAMIAKRLAKTGIFGVVTGTGALELGPAWESLEPRLATPSFPFAIVAGKISGPLASNPLVEGESDFVVSVEETHLDGATESKQFAALHSFLMDSPEVHRFVLQFLGGA